MKGEKNEDHKTNYRSEPDRDFYATDIVIL